MISFKLEGIVAAPVLPMLPDFAIDWASLRSYIGWIAQQGPVALAINVGAMLIAFTALVALLNAFVGWVTVKTHLAPPESPLTLQRVFGMAFAPLAWLAGVSWHDAPRVGSLLGTKTVLNELIAYVDLSKLPPDALDPRSKLIMLYAMCGFANFASLGIMIGGLGTMAPERRGEINALGLKSIVSGTLTTCLIGAIVGVLN